MNYIPQIRALASRLDSGRELTRFRRPVTQTVDCITSQVGQRARDAATNVYLYWLAFHLDAANRCWTYYEWNLWPFGRW